jgi:hypothetical protein
LDETELGEKQEEEGLGNAVFLRIRCVVGISNILAFGMKLFGHYVSKAQRLYSI